MEIRSCRCCIAWNELNMISLFEPSRIEQSRASLSSLHWIRTSLLGWNWMVRSSGETDDKVDSLTEEEEEEEEEEE